MNTPQQPGSSEYLKLLGRKRFHYRWWPRLSCSRLVLLHGRGECADIWTVFANGLKTQADIISTDLRGHGGTPWDPDGRYDSRDFLDDLCLQLSHWARSCVLVGAGLGARIAIEGALASPEFVKALVLIETEREREPQGTLVERLGTASVGDSDGEPGQDAVPGYFWREVYRELTWAGPDGGRVPKCDPDLLGGIDERPVWDRVAGVSQPALVIHGDDDDQVAEQDARHLARRMPAGEYVTVPGGRWPHIAAPAHTADAVARFLVRVGSLSCDE